MCEDGVSRWAFIPILQEDVPRGTEPASPLLFMTGCFPPGPSLGDGGIVLEMISVSQTPSIWFPFPPFSKHLGSLYTWSGTRPSPECPVTEGKAGGLRGSPEQRQPAGGLSEEGEVVIGRIMEASWTKALEMEGKGRGCNGHSEPSQQLGVTGFALGDQQSELAKRTIDTELCFPGCVKVDGGCWQGCERPETSYCVLCLTAGTRYLPCRDVESQSLQRYLQCPSVTSSGHHVRAFLGRGLQKSVNVPVP